LLFGAFVLKISLQDANNFNLADKMLGAILSSESEISLKVFLCLMSISLIINKDHLSPTTSSVEEIGQPERNLIIIFYIITINSIVMCIFTFN